MHLFCLKEVWLKPYLIFETRILNRFQIIAYSIRYSSKNLLFLLSHTKVFFSFVKTIHSSTNTIFLYNTSRFNNAKLTFQRPLNVHDKDSLQTPMGIAANNVSIQRVILKVDQCIEVRKCITLCISFYTKDCPYKKIF